MRCANQNCVKSGEHRGGRFKLVGQKWFCQDCAEWAGSGAVMNAGKNLYDFTTTALTGKPIHVRNKAHLQQLERQHGVSHQQLNNMERNW